MFTISRVPSMHVLCMAGEPCMYHAWKGEPCMVHAWKGGAHACIMHERENHARSMHGMVDLCMYHAWYMHPCMEYVETCMFHVQNFQQGCYKLELVRAKSVSYSTVATCLLLVAHRWNYCTRNFDICCAYHSGEIHVLRTSHCCICFHNTCLYTVV